MDYKKQQLELDMDQQTSFKLGKEYIKAVCYSRLFPCLSNLSAENIIQNIGLNDSQAGINIAGRNINNLRHADDTLQWQKMNRN